MRTKIIVIITCIIFSCNSERRMPSKSTDIQSIKQELKLNHEFLKGNWIAYHSETINRHGRRSLKNYISGLSLIEFKDSTFKKSISRAGINNPVEMEGTFFLYEDTLVFPNNFRDKYITDFDKEYLEIEDFRDKTFNHQIYKHKKLQLFHQAKLKSEVNDFLTKNSVSVIRIDSIDCKQNKRYEFQKGGRFDKFSLCLDKNKSWRSGIWELDDTNLTGELFIKFSSSLIYPIHIKQVLPEMIIGVRYDHKNIEYKFQKLSPVAIQEELIGNWKVVNSSNSSKIRELLINEYEIQVVFNNGQIDKCTYKRSQSNDLLYLKIIDGLNSKEKRQYVIWIEESASNNAKVIFQIVEKYANNLTLDLEKI